MNILHVNSYYIGNQLYKQLFEELSKNPGIRNYVYIPVRDERLVGKNKTENENIRLSYDHILGQIDRIFYRNKISKQAVRIQEKMPMNNINLIHAHSLFSDGGTAYLLHQKFNLNYVVTIRGTDINYFYKYRFDLRQFIYKVLIGASRIIFVSKAYEQKVAEILPQPIYNQIYKKFCFLPNGIQDHWLEEPIGRTKKTSNRLLFVGELNKNKNIMFCLKVLRKLNESSNERYHLTIVGEGELENEIVKKAMRWNVFEDITLCGRLDNAALKDIMDNNHIFILPSHKETFGIVYIEAIARGLPVLYTQGQGIDRVYDEGLIGYSVSNHDVYDVIRKIDQVKDKYSEISLRCREKAKSFSWQVISDSLKSIYNEITN